MMHLRKRNPKLTPETLKQWRAQMGVTQSDAAELLGVSQVCWSQWETGRSSPPFYLGYALNWIREHSARPATITF